MSDAPQAARTQAVPPPAVRWIFGPAVLDERRRELTVRGTLVSVERKPLDVLFYLLQRAGEVVTKDELLAAVWPGRILTEQVLTQCIRKLREALGDDEAVIKTVHGVGYRLVTPVRVEHGAPPDSLQPAADVATAPAADVTPAGPIVESGRRSQLPVVAAMAAALAVGVLAWIGGKGLSTARAEKSVAILPFTNLSADPDSQHFTDGLHDSVITHMASVHDLRVISRTSVMSYRQGDRRLGAIADELGVAHIVEASVQRIGNRLHVNAQLIDTAADAHVWAAEYDRDLSDVFEVQAEIAQQIARAVHAELRPEEKARIEKAPTANMAAYDLYVRALESYREAIVPTIHPAGLTVAGNPRFAEVVALLDQAVALDPDFAAAHALLSRTHDWIFSTGLDPGESRLAKVRDAAATALRLDPGLAQAHMAHGIYLYHGARDYPAAIAELETARRLAPGDATVHTLLATILRRQGRWDEALAGFAVATRLDPRNEFVLHEHATTLNVMRRYAEADAIYARLVVVATRPDSIRAYQAYNRFALTGKLEPVEEAFARIPDAADPSCGTAFFKSRLRALRRDFAGAVAAIEACPGAMLSGGGAHGLPKEFFLGQWYRLAGDLERARAYYRQVRPRMEQARRERPNFPHTPLAYVLANLGDRAAALAEAEHSLERIAAANDAMTAAGLLVEVARFHASVGERARALDELEQGLTRPGWMPAHDVALDPAWDPLRGDPRFKKLMVDTLPRS